MIAVKFMNGRVLSWKYPCNNLDEIRPNKDGFALYEWNGEEQDIYYLKLTNGILIIDEQAKQSDIAKAAKAKEISVKRTRLTALSQDLIQAVAGETVPNLIERKQEFIQLHNEIREYEDKPPRETQEEIL